MRREHHARHDPGDGWHVTDEPYARTRGIADRPGKTTQHQQHVSKLGEGAGSPNARNTVAGRREGNGSSSPGWLAMLAVMRPQPTRVPSARPSSRSKPRLVSV